MAHRVGEPFGSVVLAVAVTVIKVGLIVSLMAPPALEAGVGSLGFPTSFVGVIIALLVLLPQTLARVARRPP